MPNDSTHRVRSDIDSLEALLANTPRTDLASWPERLCTVWPVLRRALRIAKVFVGPEADRVIDEIISSGDASCGSSS